MKPRFLILTCCLFFALTNAKPAQALSSLNISNFVKKILYPEDWLLSYDQTMQFAEESEKFDKQIQKIFELLVEINCEQVADSKTCHELKDKIQRSAFASMKENHHGIKKMNNLYENARTLMLFAGDLACLISTDRTKLRTGKLILTSLFSLMWHQVQTCNLKHIDKINLTKILQEFPSNNNEAAYYLNPVTRSTLKSNETDAIVENLNSIKFRRTEIVESGKYNAVLGLTFAMAVFVAMNNEAADWFEEP